MTQIIQLDKADLEEILTRVEQAVKKMDQLLAQQNSVKAENQERGGVEFACKILGRSKSWLYKMIAVLPHKKFNKTLIFNRIELENWLAENTEEPGQRLEILNATLAASATRRLVRN